jgi:CheY-like chemotaxis protein
MKIQHTIVLIDDDRDDLLLLHEVIKSLNGEYAVIEAENGEVGLLLINKLEQAGEAPCLIVLDLNMPRMDGRETFVELRKNHHLRNTPILIFSTSSHTKDREFFEDKQSAYLVKPVRFHELLTAAQRMINLCGESASDEAENI